MSIWSKETKTRTTDTSQPGPVTDTFHTETLIISIDPAAQQAMHEFSQGIRALQHLVQNNQAPELLARITDALNQVRQGWGT